MHVEVLWIGSDRIGSDRIICIDYMHILLSLHVLDNAANDWRSFGPATPNNLAVLGALDFDHCRRDSATAATVAMPAQHANASAPAPAAATAAVVRIPNKVTQSTAASSAAQDAIRRRQQMMMRRPGAGAGAGAAAAAGPSLGPAAGIGPSTALQRQRPLQQQQRLKVKAMPLNQQLAATGSTIKRPQSAVGRIKPVAGSDSKSSTASTGAPSNMRTDTGSDSGNTVRRKKKAATSTNATADASVDAAANANQSQPTAGSPAAQSSPASVPALGSAMRSRAIPRLVAGAKPTISFDESILALAGQNRSQSSATEDDSQSQAKRQRISLAQIEHLSHGRAKPSQTGFAIAAGAGSASLNDTRNSTTVLVSNLSASAREVEIARIFAAYGEIKSSRFVPERNMCFIQFAARDTAQLAIESMNHSMLNGTTVQCQFARALAHQLKNSTYAELDELELRSDALQSELMQSFEQLLGTYKPHIQRQIDKLMPQSDPTRKSAAMSDQAHPVQPSDLNSTAAGTATSSANANAASAFDAMSCIFQSLHPDQQANGEEMNSLSPNARAAATAASTAAAQEEVVRMRFAASAHSVPDRSLVTYHQVYE